MNKRVKAICCALAVTLSLVIAPTTTKIGPFGVDVVSAATGEAPATPAATGSSGSSGSSVSYSSTNSNRTLTVGSNGSDVKLLQTALNSNGAKLVADGWFGELTAAAVKDYQKQKGLAVDGIVGPNTLAVLVPASAVPKTTVGIGITGNDVKYLQSNLNKIGYKLDVDGIFGNLTLDAVKKFQKESGLDVDGFAGPKTFAKLFEKATAPVAVAPTTPATPTTPTTPTTTTTPSVDTVAAASVVNNTADFKKAISKDGKWIIATLNDLTSSEPLVLDGMFKNGKKDATTGRDTLQRKIALYTQDDKHNVTARFTLTAPKLTIMSANASIQHGTFKGDLYVAVPDFQLVDAVVDGNIYFSTKSAKDTFKMDAKSSVTGKQELKLLQEVDVVTTASIVNENSAFEKAISKDGKWIIPILNNLTFDKELAVDGTFKNGKKNADGTDAIQRKIALYSQDDKHNTTAKFTLTAPKLTFNSPMGSIEKGIFKGDLYIGGENFQLKDCVVDGNVFFTNQKAADTFKMDATSIITGKKVNNAVDTVAGATQVNGEDEFAKKISQNNTNYMVIVNKDLTFTKDLIVESGIKAGANGATSTPNRSIAPCHEITDANGKSVVDKRYTITVPNLVFSGLNEKVEYGIIKGDVYVQTTGFTLKDATINGNLYFATQALMDAFKKDATTVITGQTAVKAYTAK